MCVCVCMSVLARFVYVHVCMHSCLYVRMHMCMCMCMFVWLSLCMCTQYIECILKEVKHLIVLAKLLEWVTLPSRTPSIEGQTPPPAQLPFQAQHGGFHYRKLFQDCLQRNSKLVCFGSNCWVPQVPSKSHCKLLGLKLKSVVRWQFWLITSLSLPFRIDRAPSLRTQWTGGSTHWLHVLQCQQHT